MGFTQEKGIDYDEVFAPTTRAETLPLALSLLGAHHHLSGCRKWGAYQINFKTAFLNSKLDKPIYMSQAPGFEDPKHPDHVYEATGSLYGLKQSRANGTRLSTSCWSVLVSFNSSLTQLSTSNFMKVVWYVPSWFMLTIWLLLVRMISFILSWINLRRPTPSANVKNYITFSPSRSLKTQNASMFFFHRHITSMISTTSNFPPPSLQQRLQRLPILRT